MEEILESSKGYFYTDLIMLLCAVSCSIIGIIKRNRFNSLSWMFVYPLSATIQATGSILFGLIYFIFQPKEFSIIENYSINIFLLIEFVSIYIFFYKATMIPKFKRNIRRVFILYCVIIFSSWLFSDTISDFPFDLFFVQALFVLILAMICLYDLFRNIPKLNLFNEPSFWIISGSLLYFLCTLPIYIAKEFVFTVEGFIVEKGMYSINFICYSFFFLLIIRAYLCKPTAQQ